jgi:hypothetical protein
MLEYVLVCGALLSAPTTGRSGCDEGYSTMELCSKAAAQVKGSTTFCFARNTPLKAGYTPRGSGCHSMRWTRGTSNHRTKPPSHAIPPTHQNPGYASTDGALSKNASRPRILSDREHYSGEVI